MGDSSRIQRVQAGRERVKAEGGRLGGPLPYGLHKVTTITIEPEPEQAHAVWLMVRCYRLGWSFEQIARQLDTLKIETPSGSARCWSKGQVRTIILREIAGQPTLGAAAG